MKSKFNNTRYGLFSNEQRQIVINHFKPGNLALARQLGVENDFFDLAKRRIPPDFPGVNEDVRQEATGRVAAILGQT